MHWDKLHLRDELAFSGSDQYSNRRPSCSRTGPALAGSQRSSGIIRPELGGNKIDGDERKVDIG